MKKGHRYYTTEDIERFREIKRLKENGLQLKAIRTVLFDQKNEIRDSVVKELDYQFRILSEEEEKRNEERLKQQEEHFRKLDETIRTVSRGKQKGSRTSDAAYDSGKRKKHSIF